MVAQIDYLYAKERPTKVISRLLSYAMFEGRPLTTKGRWINPVVFGHFAIEKKLPQLKRVEKPVFIIGTGRSGTTILGVLLSMHRSVGFLNEPKALWHSIFPSEDVIGSYSVRPAKYRLNHEDATTQVVKNAHRLFGAYLWAVRAERLVDKYPELVFRTPFVKEIFPDAKFIFLVRNGWDTCSSIDKWSKRLGVRRGNETHDWWGLDQRKWKIMFDELVMPNPIFKEIIEELGKLDSLTDMAAVEWIVTMREGLMRVEEDAASVLMIKYEDLVSDPKTSLQSILDFVGLENDDSFYNYAESVLEPAPVHGALTLNPHIRPIFEETMKMLGYPV